MPPPLDAELRRHASALRGLARALVGGRDADDLLQEATLQALQQPRPPLALRAWLRRALLHLAGKHHRAAALRRQREADLAPQPVAPPTDCVAEHRETLRRLDRALLELPEPYQATLLLRYFEELTPLAIAQRTQVPVATVKSRLQRGLALLRERLDGDSGDWRAAFAAAFALERALPVAAIGSGVAIMGMGSGVKWFAGGVAALLLATAWFVVRAAAPQGAPADAAPPPAAVAATAAAGAADGQQPSRSTDATAGGSAVVAARATLRGRCLAVDGTPVAAVQLRLDGSLPSQGRPAGWVDIEQTTAADGRFAIDFPLPEHCWFHLQLDAPGFCSSRASLHDLRPAAVVDLGDVVLQPALGIAGRVVDTTGKPLPGITLSLNRTSTGADRPLVKTTTPTLPPTAADGTFAGHSLPPGRYWLHPTNRQLARERYVTFELDAARQLPQLELVVFSEAERPPFRGIVVDDAGAPIAGASVSAGDAHASTGSDGSFELHAVTRQQPEPPWILSAFASGHARAQSGPHPPGSSALRIVLPRLPANSLRVLVLADDTGEPVPSSPPTSPSWTTAAGEDLAS